MSLVSFVTTQDDVLSAFPQQTTLALLIEYLVEGAALFDAAGSLIEINDALLDLLEQEPERARLERELLHAFDLVSCRHLTRSNARPGAVPWSSFYQTELRTSASRYRIRAIVGGEGIRPIIVLVQLLVRRSFDHAELRDRFHLTPREMQVSRLLATGCSTAALARVLEISVHTARRHLEHVLTKLGVHSRGAAAALLRE